MTAPGAGAARPPAAAPLYVGLDAGGTKTELRAAAGPGDEALTLFGPAAQVQRAGPARAAEVLAALVREALDRRGAPLAAVCAGLAGAGRAADQEAVARALVEALGTAHIRVVSDADIALEAAFEGASGILVIAGTGSIALARTDDGTRLRAGGWGYLLGDEGSGYALGNHALRAVAAALDGGPDTALVALARDRFGIADAEDLIRRVYREAWPLQEAAPLLLDAARDGDAEARRIVAEQTGTLAAQVARLAARCGPLHRRVALLGGLAASKTYRDALHAALRTHLPDWTLVAPRQRPAAGAWRLAYRE